MPLQSSDTRPNPATPTTADGPVLECAPPGIDVADQLLRIRALRLYRMSRDDLFATWTRRTAWESWMRLRARSRAMLAAYRGGPFRLELAEGPTIHVITGTVIEVHAPDLLSLSWVHHNTNDHGSTIDVSFRQLRDDAALTLVHRGIASRREAAWLMRLWTTVLDRLGRHVSEARPSAVNRLRDFDDRVTPAIESEVQRRYAGSAAERRASSAA